jgi:serine/threonine protein kinase
VSIESYGEYQLLKKLATGGMAQIFLARQQGLEGFEKFLVVKRILPHLAENDDFIKMFLDEARIAARLNHPNIVQIFNLGAQDDSYFIAMEFIHGEDVRRIWKRADSLGKPIPVPLVARVIMDACSGLDYAHKKTDAQGKPLNIVHRDISPQNILVTFEGGVKVVDFGIAKAADQATVTKSGVLKGKYSYMSPEQASGRKIDCRSDIFALGVVLYELITGVRLFKRPNDIQTLNAVTECEVALPSIVNSRVPKALDEIVMKALAKRPEDRYQEAIALQSALENWALAGKLPSSSVHLAAFMREIYAERLALEAEEGRMLVEGLDAPKSGLEEQQHERATPISKAEKRQLAETLSIAAVEAPDENDLTRALRPGRPAGYVSGAISRGPLVEKLKEKPPPPVLEPPTIEALRAPHISPPRAMSMTITSTERTAPPKKPLFAIGIVVALSGVVAGGAWAVMVNTERADVGVSSEPAGATVQFDGKMVTGCRTPCRLPQVSSGSYTVVVGKAGFQDSKRVVDVPRSGSVELPVFKLEPQ